MDPCMHNCKLLAKNAIRINLQTIWLVSSSLPSDASLFERTCFSISPFRFLQISFSPRRGDDGELVKCQLTYLDYWNYTIPYPTCFYGPLSVKYRPRIKCSRLRHLDCSAKRQNVTCTIAGNPMVDKRGTSMVVTGQWGWS